MSDARAIGRTIKALRIMTGLSQIETAARLGVSPGSLSLAETGRRPLGAQTTIRLLAILARAREAEIPRTAA